MAFILQLECLQRGYWLKIFEKKNPFSNFKIYRFLYRGSENGKFLPFKLGPSA